MSLSFKIVSLAQLAVQVETLIAIDTSAKDPAGRYASAQVALQVATAFSAVAAGDVQGAVAQAVQAILAKVTDPGQVALVNVIASIGTQFITTAAQANGALPLLNVAWQGVAAEIAAGITATASAYPDPTASKK